MILQKFLLPLCCLSLLTATAQTPISIRTNAPTRHGPEKGSLLIIGGNLGSTEVIWKKFTELAGGKDKAIVVVITAAMGDSAAYDQQDVEEVKKQTGIKNVTLLHSSRLSEANSEAFIAPLKKATGVYFVGGRQWRIADAYLNTLTHQAFFDVLNRGGVIAGSLAGATIQGSFLWRGDTKGAQVLIGDHTQGLGFLKNSAIDQHLLKRNRQFDLVEFIRQSPFTDWYWAGRGHGHTGAGRYTGSDGQILCGHIRLRNHHGQYAPPFAQCSGKFHQFIRTVFLSQCRAAV
jgi:cyanophycinase